MNRDLVLMMIPSTDETLRPALALSNELRAGNDHPGIEE
jgi:hypothetical protein